MPFKLGCCLPWKLLQSMDPVSSDPSPKEKWIFVATLTWVFIFFDPHRYNHLKIDFIGINLTNTWNQEFLWINPYQHGLFLDVSHKFCHCITIHCVSIPILIINLCKFLSIWVFLTVLCRHIHMILHKKIFLGLKMYLKY